MYADGARNVRDIGGWNGLNQGWAFRGSELDLVGTHGLQLTEAGRKVMHDDLGIKTDLDFRTTELTESPIGSDVQFINDYRIGNYTSAFAYKSALYSGVIKTFADIDNYPIYFHCWGGADRTGTVAFILEAMCGVSEADLSVDFELTSFSNFGARYRFDYGTYLFASTVAKLKEYEGDSLQEKAENYAITNLDLTRAEVSNIQSILSGNAVVFENKDITVATGRKTKAALKNLGAHTVSSVKVNNTDAEFSLNENILYIKTNESGEGIITFEDGNILKFNALEVDTCTTQTLTDGFTRLSMNETEFLGGEPYKFPVTISEDGEYAVFLNKVNTEANNFKVTFTKDDAVVTLADGTVTKAGYSYNYVRVGSAEGETPVSASLTAGDWVVSITPAVDTNISFIDIRLTSVGVTGAPQAIYPSDFNCSDVIADGSHINGQISLENAKISGYMYYGDYQNDALENAFSKDRQIRISDGNSVTYKLNVKQAGEYKIAVNHSFLKENAYESDISAKLSVVSDVGETVSKEYIFASNESGKTDATDVLIEKSFEEGIHTIVISSENVDSYIHHIYLEKLTSDNNDLCISVDNNLTRIEPDTEANDISAGTTRSFDFTVPVDGNYSFYALIGSKQFNATVAVKNLDTQEIYTYYDGVLYTYGGTFRKLGIDYVPDCALKANTKYRLYITSSVDITVSFIDVMNTNIEVSGKTAISPQYFSSTNIVDPQINCADRKNNVIPESGYTLAGNFLDDRLKDFNGYKTGYAVTPCLHNQSYMIYTLDVKKSGRYKVTVDVGKYGTCSSSETMIITVDETEKTANYDITTTNTIERLTGPEVYLTEGIHTLKIHNPSGGSISYYLSQILLTPTKGAAVTLKGNDASVSADFIDSYTGTAIIAIYDDNDKIIGLSNKALTNENELNSDIKLTATPASAKVFIWNSFGDMVPLTANLLVTDEDDSWIIIPQN